MSVEKLSTNSIKDFGYLFMSLSVFPGVFWPHKLKFDKSLKKRYIYILLYINE